MTKSSFALAQERLNARRQARDAAAQANQQASTSSVDRLPFPLNNLGHVSLSTLDRIKGREGTRPAFRVGQVDAELLDEELLEMLRGQVGEGLKYFGTHLKDDWSAEVSLILRGILFKLSIWDHNATYGAALQNLRFTDARSTSPTRPPPTRWQKSIYGLVTVGGSYAWRKWNDFLLTQNEYSTSDSSPQIARLSQLSSVFSSAHSFLALISFCAFLVTGRYRTLLDRMLRLRLTPPTNQASRAISFEYLNRQLVWHAFTEFLLFALPLIGISRWKRWIRRIWRNARNAFSSSPSSAEKDLGEFHYLPERTCAICYQDQQSPLTTETTDPSLSTQAALNTSGGIIGSSSTDITNPYSAIPCGCLYCYVCLAQRLEAEEGEGITCLRCGVLVRECQSWDGDVVLADREEYDNDNEKEEAQQAQVRGGKNVGFTSDESDNESDDEAGEMTAVEPRAESDTGDQEGDTTAVDDDGVEPEDVWSKIHHDNGFEDGGRVVDIRTSDSSDGNGF